MSSWAPAWEGVSSNHLWPFVLLTEISQTSAKARVTLNLYVMIRTSWHKTVFPMLFLGRPFQNLPWGGMFQDGTSSHQKGFQNLRPTLFLGQLGPLFILCHNLSSRKPSSCFCSCDSRFIVSCLLCIYSVLVAKKRNFDVIRKEWSSLFSFSQK
jgi:hypothetical protein